MIFLSAQPDDFYFTWQLELLVFNLNKLGVSPDDIHILIGYHPKRGLRHYFVELIERNEGKASFFCYPDSRIHKKYLSSIRPHIVRQHFIRFPHLEKEAVFYHDSDIVLHELPDFSRMLKDEVWYVSDTRNYLDSNYVKGASDDRFFEEMCRVVGVAPEIVTANDENCGGAQYLLKNTTAAFWEKIESDSERLFVLMEEHLRERWQERYIGEGLRRSAFDAIQSWCADMWAVFWNGLLLGKSVRIDPELDFCWIMEPAENFGKKKIFHYTGAKDKAISAFIKGEYTHYTPFGDPFLRRIDTGIVDQELVKMIGEFVDVSAMRKGFRDIVFFLPVRKADLQEPDNMYAFIQLVNKYFDTRILIAEIGEEPFVDKGMLSGNCECVFVNGSLSDADRQLLFDQMAGVRCIVFCDANTVLSPTDLLAGIERSIANDYDIVVPDETGFVKIDQLFQELFRKIADAELFVWNSGKFLAGRHRPVEGPFFLKPRFDLFSDLCQGDFCVADNYKVLRFEGTFYQLRG